MISAGSVPLRALREIVVTPEAGSRKLRLCEQRVDGVEIGDAGDRAASGAAHGCGGASEAENALGRIPAQEGIDETGAEDVASSGRVDHLDGKRRLPDVAVAGEHQRAARPQGHDEHPGVTLPEDPEGDLEIPLAGQVARDVFREDWNRDG